MKPEQIWDLVNYLRSLAKKWASSENEDLIHVNNRP